MGAVAAWAWDHARVALLLVAVITVALGAGLARLRLDTSLEGLLGHDAPSVRAGQQVQALFGRDEGLVVVVEAADVLTVPVLQEAAALVDAFEALDGIATVHAPTNAPVAWAEERGEAGRWVRVGPALRPWPEDAAALQARVEALRGRRLFDGLLLDRDRTLLLLVVRVDDALASLTPSRAALETAERARALVASARPDFEAVGAQIWLTGKLATPAALGRTLAPDLARYAVLALCLSAVWLWARFRRLDGVLLALGVSAAPTVGTLGAMGWAGDPLQLPSAILPPLTLVITVSGVVHVIEALDAAAPREGADRGVVVDVLARKAEPLVIAAATTAVGTLSLVGLDVGPAQVVGRYGTLAAALGLLATVVVVPAWASLRRWTPPSRDPARGLRATFAALAARTSGYALPIVVVAGALTLIAGGVAAQARFAHDPLRWLPATWEERVGVDRIDARMAVSMDLDLVVDLGPDGVASTTGRQTLRAVVDALRDQGTTRSLSEHLDDVQAAFGGPEDARSVRRDVELLRLSAGPVVDELLTPDGRLARVRARAATGDAAAYPARIEAAVDAVTRVTGAPPVHIGGLMPVFAETWTAIGAGARWAWPLAAGVGAVLLGLLTRSARLGVALLLPNALPALWVVAGLHLLGQPMDLFMLLTVSLAMGVVVDDAIHLVATLDELDGPMAARHAGALAAAGPAMALTTALLVSGWLTLGTSSIPAVRVFAVTASATLVLGLVADVLVTPAVFALVAPVRASRPAARGAGVTGGSRPTTP